MTAESASTGPGEEFRLARIRPDASRAAVERPEPGRAAPLWDVPRAKRRFPWFEVVLSVIGILCIVASIIGYLSLADAYTVAHVAVLAALPLVVVIAVLLYIDRWEPEPWWTRGVAFAWGAGVAIIVASIVNSAVLLNASLVLGDETEAMRFTAVVVAPLAEETMKAAGVLLIVLARRNTIHSFLDGVVYAGFSGAGFAFIENMQYFLQASTQGQAALTVTLILRGVLSPFVHPMATSFTGMALAWAVVRSRTSIGRVATVILGCCLAVATHSMWNFLGSGDVSSWLSNYVLFEVPFFALWMTALLVLSNREARSIREGLVPYVRTGWILPAEVDMVADAHGRRTARRWARGGGKDASRAMAAFLGEIAALGLDQRMQERLGPRPGRVEADRDLLRAATGHREEFLRLVEVAASANGRQR